MKGREEIGRREEKKNDTITLGRKKVQLTNLNKIYWPEEGYVKGQMIAYYEHMEPYIIPYLKNKPISLHRFPNGIDKDGFFQKDVDTEKMPDWLKTKAIYRSEERRE